MSGYSGNTNLNVGRISGIGDGERDYTNEYFRGRQGVGSRVEIFRLAPGEEKTLTSNGGVVRFEQWGIIPVVSGSTGFINVYHGAGSSSGLVTLQIPIGNILQYRPQIADGGAIWTVKNTSAAAVNVNLTWQAGVV